MDFWQKRKVPIITIQWWSHGTIILTPMDLLLAEVGERREGHHELRLPRA